jgi:hypothetical protein
MKRFFIFFSFLSLVTVGCRDTQRGDIQMVLVEPEIAVSVAGKIICPSNAIPTMSNVTLVLKSSTGFSRTLRPNANGTFLFGSLEPAVDYTLTVSRAHDPNLNLANYSLNEFSGVMLGSQPFPTTRLGFLAIDFDQNGDIEATDVMQYRRILLGIVTNDALWRFVSNDLADGTNTATRIGDVNKLTLKNLTSNANNCNFFLLRMGNLSLNECQ